MIEHRQEVLLTLHRIRTVLEELTLGGLRTAAPAQLQALEAAATFLHRCTAPRLAGHLTRLQEAIAADDPVAPAALLRAHIALQLFERLLTRQAALAALEDR